MIEQVVGQPNDIPEGKFSDLNMMVQYASLERRRRKSMTRFDSLVTQHRIGRGGEADIEPDRLNDRCPRAS